MFNKVVYATKTKDNIIKIIQEKTKKNYLKMDDRIEKIKEFLTKNPDDNFLNHALALEYIKLGNDKEARKLFEEILTQDADYLGSYYQLAKLLERNNETSLAKSYYEKGMQTAKKLGDSRTYNELRSAYEELIY